MDVSVPAEEGGGFCGESETVVLEIRIIKLKMKKQYFCLYRFCGELI